MLDWLYQWWWPSVAAEQVFGAQPRALGIDAASAAVLAARFPGRVVDLSQADEASAKRELIAHVVGQTTERSAAKTLLILQQPCSKSAQIHLRRLLDHRSALQTWVALIDASEPVEVEIKENCVDGKHIV